MPSNLTPEQRERLAPRAAMLRDLVPVQTADLRALLADSEALGAAEAKVARLREALEGLLDNRNSPRVRTFVVAADKVLRDTAPDAEGGAR